MRKFFYILLFGLAFPFAALRAQTITEAEYYFDGDPGIGNGVDVPLSSDTTVSLNFSAATAGLSIGLHKLNLRVKDDANRWSNAGSWTFSVYNMAALDTGRTITAAEYFFDIDPGQGNGSSLAVQSGPEVSFSTDILEDLFMPPGQHRLSLRVKDNLNRWSNATTGTYFKFDGSDLDRNLDIVAAEYFFNNDPGPGNGTPLLIQGGPVVSFSDEIIESMLVPVGTHKFSLRFKDERNVWGIPQSWPVLVRGFSGSVIRQSIAAGEYFVGTDPGVGFGVPLIAADGAFNDTLEVGVDTVSGLPVGTHIFGFRFRDNRGLWTETTRDTLSVTALTVLSPGNPPTLHWDAGGATGPFYIYRAISPGEAFVRIDSVNVPEYVDINILRDDPVAEAVYYYITVGTDSLAPFSLPAREANDE